MKAEDGGGGRPERELYAVLQVSPEASDEEIRKAYRHWAQVYHPDKYQDLHMKEIATQNFQRICQAYEILSDENKRIVYDIYGMEGLNSGLELGPKLSRVEELKEELERLRKLKEEQKRAFIRPSGTVLANLSLPRFLDGDGIMQGMAMTSQIHSQLSKRNAIALGGNLQVNEGSGGAAATTVLRHELSPFSSVEFIASAGLQELIGIQTTRQLSSHSTATITLAKSLKDSTINLSNTWTRKISETTSGNIQLLLGPQSSVSVGWQKKDVKMSASGQLKIGIGSFGASGHYTHRFTAKSHGRIGASVGSKSLEMEVGGGRKVSEFSTVRMLYVIGIQGIVWRLELHRGDQKLIIPVLLLTHWNPVFAAGAFVIPTSLYFLLHTFVLKPYLRKREKQKALENKNTTSAKVREARIAAEKAQQLLQTVANRKRNKQTEINGLVIMTAVYGKSKILERGCEPGEAGSESTSEVIDVTVPLNFLVNDSNQLKLHEGVKKSGIMGFCDPCPGEPKRLLVGYTYGGRQYEVVVDDYAELLIPQEEHRV